jgi:endothelin-converting enzyme/putative endopeptidase
LKKLDAIAEKVGYPESWPSTLPVAAQFDSWLDESMQTQLMVTADTIHRLGEQPNRMTWSDSPIVINAYYGWLRNEIVFPAGILQPPHFDPRRPRVANLGAIGVTMGHELTHGFDAHGRFFDETGSLSMWWTPEVSAEFDRRAQCLIDRYDKFEILPGEHVDGKRTLSENIADLGGLRLAYEAFKTSERQQPTPAYEGLDARQQFFLAYGQVWCTVESPTITRSRLTGSHGPPEMRVNGPLSQMSEFAEAFHCAPGSPMPGAVCEIW